VPAILAPVSDLDADPSWSVTEDSTTGALEIHLFGHVDVDTIHEAVSELVTRLRERAVPTLVVADLLDVTGFDVDVPVAAVRLAAPVSALIDAVEIIVQRRMVRIAAVSAAHLLGLRCTVRAFR